MECDVSCICCLSNPFSHATIAPTAEHCQTSHFRQIECSTSPLWKLLISHKKIAIYVITAKGQFSLKQYPLSVVCLKPSYNIHVRKIHVSYYEWGKSLFLPPLVTLSKIINCGHDHREFKVCLPPFSPESSILPFAIPQYEVCNMPVALYRCQTLCLIWWEILSVCKIQCCRRHLYLQGHNRRLEKGPPGGTWLLFIFLTSGISQ